MVPSITAHRAGRSLAASTAIDNPASSRSRLRGAEVPVVDVGRCASWWSRFSLNVGITRRARVYEGHELGDIENPVSAAARSSALPSLAQLMELSKRLVDEEQRVISPALRSQFYVAQKKILETTYTDQKKYRHDVDEAKKYLLEMHDVTQAYLDDGFKRGGTVYAFRNYAGSLLAFLPLIITGIRLQPKHAKDIAFQVNAAAGYFASVLLASGAGVACNARVLMHCTPIQDAKFNGSPNIAKELRSDVTPSYPAIKKELIESLGKSIEIQDDLKKLVDAKPLSELSNTERSHLRDALNAADFQDKDHQGKGVKYYLSRAQLHRVYIEGLKIQSGFQTMKVFGNFAAGWVTFLEKNKHLGIYIQLGAGFGQIIAQLLTAPYDQKTLQNAMFDLEIMARPLSGINHREDDKLIRGMMRTPLEVRVANLQLLMIMRVDEVAQQIGDMLKMRPADYKKYRQLLSMEKRSHDFQLLNNTVVERKKARLSEAIAAGEVSIGIAEVTSLPELHPFAGLLSRVAAITGIDLISIEQMVDLKRRDDDSDNSLSDDERERLNSLRVRLADLPADRTTQLVGSSELYEAFALATRRRSSQNSAVASELLAVALGVLSTRYSDGEILSEMINEATVAKGLNFPQTDQTRGTGGRDEATVRILMHQRQKRMLTGGN